MGSKLESKKMMREAGVPSLPSSEGGITTIEAGQRIAERLGYPVILKASGGGGGIGMQIVNNGDELENALNSSMRIAQSAFGDSTIFIEKYLVKPRHIEFQILADTHGNRIHLFDRECSIQRRHQKIVEETPSQALDPQLRQKMKQQFGLTLLFFTNSIHFLFNQIWNS
jgi:pyruvate carboxylase subunit A